MVERREEHRSRTYLGAKAIFNHRLSVYDCLVRNLSEKGARLVFDYPAMLPAEFELAIALKGDTRRVRVQWRGELEAGVTFLDQQVVPFVPLKATQKIRSLEAEREALKARVAQLSTPS